MKTYDIIVVGGGAGLKIARPAADLGHKVAIIEEAQLGGTCLNRGCIPSKMLIHPADIIQQVKEASACDVHLEGKLNVNIEHLVQHVSNEVDADSNSIFQNYQNYPNLDLYTNRAHFIEPYVLKVGDAVITAKKIFLAVGARPYIPNIEGLAKTPYWTSTEVLRLEKLPKSVLIMGGGFIACELGHYLDAMGVKVHFVVRGPFMRSLDAEIQQHFQETFEKRFHVTTMDTEKVEYDGSNFTLHGNQGEKISAEGLFVATGVVPNSDQLNLDVTQVELDHRGFIKADDYLQTTQPGVYAFGDIIGRCLFRHSANFEGEYLFDQHFKTGVTQEPIHYSPVPYGVFTWPQIGGVGKNENELQESGHDYISGVNRYKDSAMGMALRRDEGFVKLLFDFKTQKLLGGHVIGEQATTMVHMIIAYLNMGATLKDLLKTIYIHPALPEIVRNAARKARDEFKKRGVDV